MADFVVQCLHGIDGKAKTLEPRTLEDVVHSTEVGELKHFDFLQIGTKGTTSDDGVDDEPESTSSP